MKRWIVAAAMLLGIGASASHADYVLIIAKVGGKRDQNQPPGTPGAPGTPGVPISPGGPGGPGGGDIPTLGGAGGQTSANIDTNAVTVATVVEARAKPRMPGQRGTSVITKWSEGKGVTRLYNDGDSLQAFLLPAISPRSQYNRKREAAFKNSTPDKVFNLADWCLTHGLVEQFTDLMDDLVTRKEDQSNSSSERLREAVKAYKEVKANLAKPIDNDSATDFWRSRLQARVETSPHYSLIYNAPVANPPEVQQRLKMLEENMRAFYYWFALRGVALPMPKEKLVAVQIDSPQEFLKQRAVLEDEPLVSDGFYATRDHVAVFSTQRVDPSYQQFLRVTQPIWQMGLNKQGLLDGTEKRKSGIDLDSWAKFQTYALLEKGLEVEGERAAVSHEGTRQLLVAAGVVPRNVVVPQWAAFGTAAALETPKGPFPAAPPEASVAWFPGYGAPSWAYLRTFREWERNGRLGEPAQLMTDVVTDALFNRVIGAKDRQGLLRARTTAWGLGFYLMKTRLPGLMRYCQELSALPRDIEVDSRTLLACFCRAFDVANATQDGPDPEKFAELAKNWIAYMKGLAAPGAEFGLDRGQGGDDPNNPGTPGTPGRPGGPGGRPGGPGGDSPGGGPGGGDSPPPPPPSKPGGGGGRG